jgi:hypothetical protein
MKCYIHSSISSQQHICIIHAINKYQDQSGTESSTELTTEQVPTTYMTFTFVGDHSSQNGKIQNVCSYFVLLPLIFIYSQGKVARKAHGGVNTWLHSFLTLVLSGTQRSICTSINFNTIPFSHLQILIFSSNNFINS